MGSTVSVMGSAQPPKIIVPMATEESSVNPWMPAGKLLNFNTQNMISSIFFSLRIKFESTSFIWVHVLQ